MKKTAFAFLLPLLIAALIFAGCGSPGTARAETGSPQVQGDSTAAQDAATDEPAEADAATDAPSEPPAGPQDVSSSAAFQYYAKISLGMTKDEVDAALGLTAEVRTGEYEPENSYQYVDGDGYGVYVIYNDELKAFTKTAIIKDEAVDVAPFTAKPVTEALKDKIEKEMAYADIVALLGGDGVEFSRTADESDPSAPVGRILHWANADGTFIQVALTSEEKAGNIMFVD